MLAMGRRFVLSSIVLEIYGLNSSLETGRNSLAGMEGIDENTYEHSLTNIDPLVAHATNRKERSFDLGSLSFV
jgi:hypothetical protein